MDKFPLTIKVYLKGTFIWNIKPGDDYLKWTKEDEKKYGNLIIEGIRVYNDK